MSSNGSGDNSRIDAIEASSAYLEELRKCRNGLSGESKRCGKELAKRLVKTFSLMKFSLFQGRGIVLNEATLIRATISFWEDILRVKAYHPIDRAEKHKKAAYIFKWISKFRPVKPLVDHPDKLTNAEMNANPMYAWLCASGYLKCKRDLPEEETKLIIYFSTYRDIHPDEWTLIFAYLERLYPEN